MISAPVGETGRGLGGADLCRQQAQTLLTLLFGLGFAVQLLRAQDRGEPPSKVPVEQ